MADDHRPLGTTGMLAEFPAHRLAPTHVNILDLERYAAQWAQFVPDDPAARIALARLLAEKYQFTSEDIPCIRQALGLDEEEIQQAFETRYGRPLAAIFARESASASRREREPIVPWLDVTTQRDVEDELIRVYLRKGETLIREGDAGDCLYVVVSGRLRAVVQDQSGNELPVAEIGRGETVGEMALVTGEKRAATIRAVRDSELLELARAGFDRLVEQHPRVLLPIVRTMAARIRRSNTTQRSGISVTTIAVAPASPGVPLPEFCRRLAAALERYGPTLHLNSNTYKHLRERSSIPESAADVDSQGMVAWLNDQETQYRYVLYEADPGPAVDHGQETLWTRRCIRQGDRLLLLCSPGNTSVGDEIDHHTLETESALDRELVLLQPEGIGHAVGTRPWLDRWPVARHHHVRLRREDDLQRLARSLVGGAVGLVLSGGGARCFAHIGVIRAIQEAGIPIDWVAGSSAGSLVAAEYAMGWDCETMLRRNRQLVSGRKSLLDYTVPIVSLLSARRLSHALHELFGETQIEDLWLSYFCTSSNLASAELEIHREGSLRRAVRASCALPGIVPPLLENGELLIDGGILDNMPVDAMKELCDGGPVIAVDVSMEFSLAKAYQFGEGISAGQLLRNRMNPFSKTKVVVPTIVNILLRTAELQAVRSRATQRARASLYIKPPVDMYGTFDTRSIDTLVGIGYEHARDQIAEWKTSEAAVWLS
jgi:predicted acylesterase/phospholipase RssA